MFHSKLSTKKKLCLDSQVLVEDQSYKDNFEFTFRLDKLNFYIVQTISDKFDLRIDNRTFDMLMTEEKSVKIKAKDLDDNDDGRYKEKVVKNTYENYEKKSTFEQIPSYLRSKGMNPRNSEGFFNNKDNNFNFAGNNVNNMRNKSQSVFLNPNTLPKVDKQSNGSKLVDVPENTQDYKKQMSVQLDPKEILNQLNFTTDNSTNNNRMNPDVFKHNQNILNNVNAFPDSPIDSPKQDDSFGFNFNATNNLGNINNIPNMTLNMVSPNKGSMDVFNLNNNNYTTTNSMNTGNNDLMNNTTTTQNDNDLKVK